jgi:methylaspartate mutase epsilon subunit
MTKPAPTARRGGPDAAAPPSFGRYVADAAAGGQLVVQPRMGFSDVRRMRAGLAAVKFATATTAGTLTLDSYTRVGRHDEARRAVADGMPLNGYPIVAYPPSVTRALLAGVLDETFPVQVRHGSSRPQRIIRALAAAGLEATEGGPVSYCLPYGRTPLRASVDNWARSCELLVRLAPPPRVPHLETFGGCMLGQLCPPDLLVAISVLEAMFFVQHGITSVSLSYAQQTSAPQDEHAIRALRRLAAELLPDQLDWHIVVYTYMGVYPSSPRGARHLLEASAQLAARSGAARLVVKTIAESRRIPTVEENVCALETAAAAAGTAVAADPHRQQDGNPVYRSARRLVEAVLELGAHLGPSLQTAFTRGYLDIPFCLHPDNAGRSRSFIDDGGQLRWSRTGSMPIQPDRPEHTDRDLTSAQLLGALHYVAWRFNQ